MDYKEMYYTLFRAFTVAISSIDSANYGAARDILVEAQQKTEEIFVESDMPRNHSITII